MTWKNFALPEMENPRLVVKKSERLLHVYDGRELLKTYRVAVGFAPVGTKLVEGDGRTPEGDFYVSVKNPKSKFHLSLGLGYPTAEDAERGLAENLISPEERDLIVEAVREKRMPPQNTRLGGEIYIHGGGIEKDWTRGCMALDDAEMEELFARIPVGTPVRIEP